MPERAYLYNYAMPNRREYAAVPGAILAAWAAMAAGWSPFAAIAVFAIAGHIVYAAAAAAAWVPTVPDRIFFAPPYVKFWMPHGIIYHPAMVLAIFAFLVYLRVAALKRGIAPAVIVSCHYLHAYLMIVLAVAARMPWPAAYMVAAVMWCAAFVAFAPPVKVESMGAAYIPTAPPCPPIPKHFSSSPSFRAIS